MTKDQITARYKQGAYRGACRKCVAGYVGDYFGQHLENKDG